MNHALHTCLFTVVSVLLTVTSLRAQVEIPLTYDPNTTRVGIKLSFLTSTPGIYTTPIPFLLDTGSPGLLVNEGVDVGASTQTVPMEQGLARFGIGPSSGGNPFNEMIGTLGLTDIHGAIHSVNTNYGQAFTGSFDGTFYSMGGTVNDDSVDTDGNKANGILGAGLTGGFYENHNFSLLSIISQIEAGPGLTPGFTVDLLSDSPTLTIGVTDQQISAFTATSALNPTLSGPTAFPNTGYSTYDQKQTSFHLDIGGMEYEAETNPGGEPTEIPVTLDTGAPTGVLLTGENSDYNLTLPTTVPDANAEQDAVLEGTTIVVTNEDGDTLYEYVTGPETEEISISNGTDFAPPTSDAHFNSGVNAFLQAKITFVLGATAGDPGYVGYTIIPEPTTGSFLLFSGASYLLLRRRKR